MNLIDTHCHLTHGRLRQNLPDVLARARAAGVEKIICAAADLPESQAALDLARREADIYCTAGVHPHDAKAIVGENLQTQLAAIEQLAGHPKNVAIGEI